MKRWIFFISYIIFFITVPFAAYYLLPVSDVPGLDMADITEGQDNPQQSKLNSDSTADSVNPYLSIDRHWEDSVKHLTDSMNKADSIKKVNGGVKYFSASDYNQMLSDGITGMFRSLHFVYASLTCFFFSFIIVFALSIQKLIRPLSRTGWIITGLCVFNILYLYGMIFLSFFKEGIAAWYEFYGFIMLFAAPAGLVIELLLALLFILTILFTVIGAIKKKAIEAKQ
jgi:hypothetical protein